MSRDPVCQVSKPTQVLKPFMEMSSLMITKLFCLFLPMLFSSSDKTQNLGLWVTKYTWLGVQSKGTLG